MTTIVFAGPSLPRPQAGEWPGITWRPPAAQGDIYRAALERPVRIGLIDGYFETVPSVWHKEILWAISQGIKVYGSSSMGALRAAELADFGMIGVGAVFDYFRGPQMRDDADVALLHGPSELGYVNLSEAHVNVHFTLARAVADGVISDGARERLLEISSGIFYKDRNYGLILRHARARGMPAAAVRAVRAWVADGRIDQKRIDARALLDTMCCQARSRTPREPSFTFQDTAMWAAARRRLSPAEPV
jgi:hypothetical protein